MAISIKPIPWHTLEVLVSVIIPTYSDSEKLMLCLQSLGAQDVCSDDFEVIVVDNHDSPTLAASDYSFLPNLVLVHEPRGGSYAARNAGIKIARGKLLLFTDADCKASKNWVGRAIELDPDSIVGGHVQLELGEKPSALEQYERVFYFNQRSYVEREKYAVTANLLVPSTVMERLGAFDASLRSGGDRLWGQKASASGETIHYDEKLLIYHPTRSLWGEFFKRRIRVMSGNLYLFHREVGLTWENAWRKIVFIINMKNFESWTGDWEYFDSLDISTKRRIRLLHRIFTLFDAFTIFRCKLSFKTMKKLTLIDR